MDTEELVKRIQELTEELGKRAIDDPKRKDIVEEISVLSKVVDSADRRDTERLNSYRQNDINEDKLRIDAERIKADRANSKRELFGRILGPTISVFGSIGLAILSFKGEWLSNVLKDRTIWDIAKSLKPRS